MTPAVPDLSADADAGDAQMAWQPHPDGPGQGVDSAATPPGADLAAALRALLRDMEDRDETLRIVRIMLPLDWIAEGLPPSMPLRFAHPVIEAHDGYPHAITTTGAMLRLGD